MNKNQEILEKGAFGRLFLNLCVPTIVIMLVLVIYNMADIYFIGQTGRPEMIAAVSLCSPIFSMLSGLGTLVGSGGCTAISLALGRKDETSIKKYSSFCCCCSLLLGFAAMAVLLLFAEPIAEMLGADADTMADTLSYMRIVAIGAPVTLFGNVFTNIIRADGAAKQSMAANLCGTFTNIVLDAIFILGFSWGTAGAAFATVLGNAAGCIYLIRYIQKKQHLLSLSPKDLSFSGKIAGAVLPLGMPLACSTLLMSFSSVFSNRLMAGYGAVAIAASSISGKIGMLITMLAMGICMGMQPAISVNYSNGNLPRVKQIIRNTAILATLIGTVLSIGCFLARNSIIAAFIDNEEILSYGQIMVIASIITGPFYGLYQLCQTFLQSTGKASYATVVALLDKGLYYLPILFTLSHLFGLYGIVFTGAVTLAFSLCTGLILSLNWARKIFPERGTAGTFAASSHSIS